MKELNDRIRQLQDDVEYYSKSTGLKDSTKKINDMRSTVDKKDREVIDLKKHINYLQDQIEDFLAENKALRDMASVPANYGIDREKVKLMDREKIDDFKKLIRVLQEDNYSLEEERAKLKHMLKQQSMMWSRRAGEGNPYGGFDLT